jgi:predicted dehydrogenase
MIDDGVNRRDFLKGAAATLSLLMSETGLSRVVVAQEPPTGPPLKLAVFGLGPWGREILTTLARQETADVVAVVDPYEPAFRRASDIVPNAQTVADWRQALDIPGLEAVVVSTPSHLHREIAVAALEAGKHVYCEAPLASTLDDVQAIVEAAQAASGKVIFQSGLQGRYNALWEHVSNFVKAGVLGDAALAVGQWNKRDSWRRPGPTPEREAALNWRLDPATSAGLPGEVGIHQFDLVSRYLGALPASITGAGAVRAWRDGRKVPDTIEVTLEFDGDVRLSYTSTLAASFAGSFTVFSGSDASLLIREQRAWMVKEADSPLLGWEVYARKEPVMDETGIALVADATKILAAGKKPGEEGAVEPEQEALYLALEDFARAVREQRAPAAGIAEGYQATVMSILAHEATMSGERRVTPPETYTLG